MKKSWLLVTTIVLIAAMLASCAPAAQPTAAPAAPAAQATTAPAAPAAPTVQATTAPAAPAAQATTAPAAPASFNWKQEQGKKITVFLSETPMADAIRSHVQEFEDQTGISVDYLVVSENDYWSKLAIDLSSGAGQYNVFMSGPTLNWGYASANQIQSLDSFISDPTLTPADWNQSDFYPWAMAANRWNATPGKASIGQGSLWAIPIEQTNNLLTYRKDLFDKYNIPVPTTWDEWATAAKQLEDATGGKVDGKAFYPVAARGALDTTTLSGPFYSGLFSYGGLDFNTDLTPAMNNAQSVAFQSLYMDTIKKYGSPEWPNQMWMDVENGFTSGQYGMVIDVGDFVPTYEGSGSAVAGKLGYAPMPAGPDGKGFTSVWTWGLSMNAKATGDEAKAAWLFMMWASNANNMTGFAKNGTWPTRVSVWNSPEVTAFSNTFGGGSFRTAFDKVLNTQVQWLVSPMVDASAVENIWVKGLQDYYFGKGTMQSIMDKAATDMTQEMKDSGTLK
jgi:multiple sugar transport system substrate-binding protein